MTCETLQFYRSICEVILKIHLIQGEKIEVKVYQNRQNSVSGYAESLIHAHHFFCVFRELLMISQG